ncbi:MAG TPA: MerR family transcriptional regulator [Nocardioides sp.]|nr:MerR family transcriptional regulator [Nocardioides sp.]
MTVTHDLGVGIRIASERTGLTPDTLRWYEREGLLPAPPRGADGRRVYDERLLAFVRLVVALRRTGMAVADVRDFVELSREGAASHGRRLSLLEEQRDSIVEQRRRLDDDLAAVEQKIDHYRSLIARGLDCDGLPVDPATAARQHLTA